jgi:hypothetical protein
MPLSSRSDCIADVVSAPLISLLPADCVGTRSKALARFRSIMRATTSSSLGSATGLPYSMCCRRQWACASPAQHADAAAIL